MALARRPAGPDNAVPSLPGSDSWLSEKKQTKINKSEACSCTSWCSCNDRDLGPGLEAGPRLDKRGSPRGLLQKLVVSWSLLVVCGCWYQNGAALFQFSFVVVLSGASCSISVVVLFVWLELPYKRCFACVSSSAVVSCCGFVVEWKPVVERII